jgi:hypothetical protein
MALDSSLRWTCPACSTENEEREPLDLEVDLPLTRNGVMRPGSSQVCHSKRVIPATCASCGLVSLYDAKTIRDQ